MTAPSLQPVLVFFVNVCSEPCQTEVVDLFVMELPKVDVRIVADITSTIQVRAPRTQKNHLVSLHSKSHARESFLTRCGGQRRIKVDFPPLVDPTYFEDGEQVPECQAQIGGTRERN